MATIYGLFTSRAGRLYKLEISFTHAANNNATYTMMLGSTPIYVQETDDEDVFLPSRYYTGYIQIYTSMIAEIIPSYAVQNKVVLYQYRYGSYQVEWTGYLKPDNMNMNPIDETQPYELAVESHLSALASVDFDPLSIQSTESIGRILRQAFYWSGMTWGKVYFPSYEIASGMLRLTASRKVFEKWDDEKQAYVSSMSCLEVVETIARFFGLTVRETWQGDIIFQYLFSRHDSVSLPGIDYLERNLSESSYTKHRQTEIQFTNSSFGSTEMELSVMPGYRTVKVTGSFEDDCSDLLKFPDSELKDAFMEGYTMYRRLPDSKLQDVLFLKDSVLEVGNSNMRVKVLKQATKKIDEPYQRVDGCLFCVNGQINLGDARTSLNPAFIVADSRNTANSNNWLVFETKEDVTLGSGYLVFNMTVYNKGTDYYDYVAKGGLEVAVSFAGRYKTQDGWQTGQSNSTISVRIGTNSDDTQKGTSSPISPLDDLTGIMNYQGGDILKITPYDPDEGADIVYRGPLRIYIRGCKLNNLHGNDMSQMWIRDFSVTFIPDKDYLLAKKKGSYTYTSRYSSKMRSEREETLEFCSDQYGVPSTRMLCPPDDAPISTFPYQFGTKGKTEIPEQWLADAMGYYYSQSRRRLTMDLRMDNVQISEQASLYEYQGKDYNLMALAPDFMNDVVRVTLVEECDFIK